MVSSKKNPLKQHKSAGFLQLTLSERRHLKLRGHAFAVGVSRTPKPPKWRSSAEPRNDVSKKVMASVGDQMRPVKEVGIKHGEHPLTICCKYRF